MNSSLHYRTGFALWYKRGRTLFLFYTNFPVHLDSFAHDCDLRVYHEYTESFCKLISFLLFIIIVLKWNRLLKEGLQKKDISLHDLDFKGAFFLVVSSQTKEKILHQWNDESLVCYIIHLKTGNISQTHSDADCNADCNTSETAFQSLKTTQRKKGSLWPLEERVGHSEGLQGWCEVMQGEH